MCKENDARVRIYIDKIGNITIVPFKVCSAGYAVATKPYIKLDEKERGQIPSTVVKLVHVIKKLPIVDDAKEKVFETLLEGKGFKNFSKKHICISVLYNSMDSRYYIANEPRLKNGSYGVEKGTLSEEYSTKYVCVEDLYSIQSNIEKAYEDAVHYLTEKGMVW